MNASEEQESTSVYGVAAAIASRPEMVSKLLNLRVTVPRCTHAFIYENIYPLLLFEGGRSTGHVVENCGLQVQ